MGSSKSSEAPARHQHGRLAAHDERERKDGDYRKILRIELAKSFDFVVAWKGQLRAPLRRETFPRSFVAN